MKNEVFKEKFKSLEQQLSIKESIYQMNLRNKDEEIEEIRDQYKEYQKEIKSLKIMVQNKNHEVENLEKENQRLLSNFNVLEGKFEDIVKAYGEKIGELERNFNHTGGILRDSIVNLINLGWRDEFEKRNI